MAVQAVERNQLHDEETYFKILSLIHKHLNEIELLKTVGKVATNEASHFWCSHLILSYLSETC